jgi:aminopeptidase N
MKIVMYKSLIALIIIQSVSSCKPIKTNTEITSENPPSTVENVGNDDSLNDTNLLKNYNPSEPVRFDLINTKLEVSFLWSESRMKGLETLTAKPHWYPQNKLVLDAKGMDIFSIKLFTKDKTTNLTFDYTEDILTINLDKTYTRNEELTVIIDYLAKPNERKTGGSAAITSDKGLYFINPVGKEQNKMPQIWTQGETEANSVWFPTVDAPNVKSKQEIYITVEDKFKTLSNGSLISSVKNSNGTRTDYWKHDKPHAPYLFMMAVGEFKMVQDFYTRPDGTKMEVNYYVEPQWESSAKAIFGETPKMISHFSQLLGYEYPWDKYSQIIVREYVSGAMENTSAVIFGDYAYKTERELLDGNDNSTIAHELFHHWFGDLVTCESWSNLTVNESFANYSQYLWDEYRYGLDEADFQAIQEARGYYQSSLNGGYHNLVWFDYNDKEQMFDGHTYNKGGRILNMLRNYIGDEAFFLGIKNYLKHNEFKAAEFHHLRLEWEAICGEDLNWFFNQWYLDKGHPSLDVSMGIGSNNTVKILVEQKQKEFRLFDLPVQVAIYDERGVTIEKIRVNEKSQLFELKTEGTVKNVVFDNQAMLLAEIVEDKPADWFQFQYFNSLRYIQRALAVKNAMKGNTEEGGKLILAALNDPFWDIRSKAMDKIGLMSPPQKQVAIDKVKDLVKNDPKSLVREEALVALSGLLSKTEIQPLLEDRIRNDKSYLVISSALSELAKIDQNSAIKLAKELENEKSSSMQGQLAILYGQTGKIEYKAYFENLFASNVLQGQDLILGMNGYALMAIQNSPKDMLESVEKFSGMYFTQGAYAQMFVPQVFEYYLENTGEKLKEIEKQKVEFKNAGKSIDSLIEEEAMLKQVDLKIKEFNNKAKLD